MTALWTAAEAERATGGRPTRDWSAAGISIDSRSVAPGDLFIALAGPTFDGHDFVASALAAGAAAAMVSRVPDGLPSDAPLLVVDDTMTALERLGTASRARCASAAVIGVTGSVGKTGTKEALRTVLAEQGPTHASAASFNNHWGVPLSLARMPRETRFGVFEMGMNHPGELARLTGFVRPDVAIVTTVEPAHLGHFASVEEIADAKAEILLGVPPRDGTAILNRDNPHFARLRAAAERQGIGRILSFGAASDADIRLLEADLGATGSRVSALVLGRRLDYVVANPGRHWVLNTLAVLGTVQAAGGDVAAAADALSRLQGLAGRGRQHGIRVAGGGGGAAVLIDESYNASPASMRAAISVLAATQPAANGRRIAVLGDMLELGEQSPQLHAELAEPLKQATINHVFTVGRDMKSLHDALPGSMRAGHADRSVDMAPVVASFIRPGDVVTVKGSLGSRMAEVVKVLLAGGDAPASDAAKA